MVLCPTLHQHDREVTLLDGLMHGTTDGASSMLPEESNEELRALQRAAIRSSSSILASRSTRVSRRLRGARLGRARRDGASARARAPPHRRDHGPAGLDREHGAAERLFAALAAAGVMRRPGAVVESELPDRRRRGCGGGDARRCPIGRPRSSRSATTSPWAPCAPLVPWGCGCPRGHLGRGLRRLEQASNVRPPLTTVRQPLAEMGRMAIGLLLRLLEHRRVEALSVELATKLVVRESTAALRA